MGFKGLLRSDEMDTLNHSMFLLLPEKGKFMVFLQGKAGVRQNIIEKVLIEDKPSSTPCFWLGVLLS